MINYNLFGNRAQRDIIIWGRIIHTTLTTSTYIYSTTIKVYNIHQEYSIHKTPTRLQYTVYNKLLSIVYTSLYPGLYKTPTPTQTNTKHLFIVCAYCDKESAHKRLSTFSDLRQFLSFRIFMFGPLNPFYFGWYGCLHIL